MQEGGESRIDDIFISAEANTGFSRPHNGPQCPQDLPKQVLHRPPSRTQRQMLVSHFEGLKTIEINTIAQEAQAVYSDSKRLHQEQIGNHEPGLPVPMAAYQHMKSECESSGITKAKGHAMASSITEIIERLNKAALEVLPAAPDRASRKSFQLRTMGRQYQKLRRERSWLIKQTCIKHGPTSFTSWPCGLKAPGSSHDTATGTL